MGSNPILPTIIMIIIETKNYEFNYSENIDLYLDEPFISINASELIPSKEIEGLTLHTGFTLDKFFIEDIISIEGV